MFTNISTKPKVKNSLNSFGEYEWRFICRRAPSTISSTGTSSSMIPSQPQKMPATPALNHFASAAPTM